MLVIYEHFTKLSNFMISYMIIISQSDCIYRSRDKLQYEEKFI